MATMQALHKYHVYTLSPYQHIVILSHIVTISVTIAVHQHLVTASAPCHCIKVCNCGYLRTLSLGQQIVIVSYAQWLDSNRKYHCCHSVTQLFNSTHSAQNSCASEATPSFHGWRGWRTRQYHVCSVQVYASAWYTMPHLSSLTLRCTNHQHLFM